MESLAEIEPAVTAVLETFPGVSFAFLFGSAVSGHAMLVRDGRLLSRYFLAVTTVAIDFRQTEKEFRAIRSRSRSPTETDRARFGTSVGTTNVRSDPRRSRDGPGVRRSRRATEIGPLFLIRSGELFKERIFGQIKFGFPSK